MNLKFLHQTTDQRRSLILNGSIVRTLLMLSIPTLMMSIVQSLIPLSDGLFINNVSGTLVASVVTYSQPIINMMTAFAQGLSVAAMAIIGQANGQGIASNITNVCFNLPAAFGSAVTTIVSMNIGAHQVDKAKKSCLWGCVLSAITAVLIIAVIVPLSGSLTAMFTKDAAVLDIANRSLHIYTYSVVGFGICMVIQGAFIGLGKTRIPFFIGILRIWLLRYIFILLTEQYLSFYSVFWGNLFSNYMAAAISIILIMRVRWVSALDNT